MFKVLQIDHVELFVPDRYEAARWYEHALGLQVVPGCEPWAAGGGPLMISSDGGSTKLALFEGTACGERPDRGVSARGVSRERRRFCGVPPAAAGPRARGLAATARHRRLGRRSSAGVFDLLRRSLGAPARSHDLRLRRNGGVAGIEMTGTRRDVREHNRIAWDALADRVMNGLYRYRRRR